MGDYDAVLFGLRRDHRKLMALVAQAEQARGAGERRRLVGLIEPALTAHAAAEARVLYPALREHGRFGDLLRQDATAEHEEIHEALDDLAHLDAAHPAWADVAASLRVHLAFHIGEEENEIFPIVRAQLSLLDPSGRRCADAGGPPLIGPFLHVPVVPLSGAATPLLAQPQRGGGLRSEHGV
jgi:Hemerythrin HHE cation binding domain